MNANFEALKNMQDIAKMMLGKKDEWICWK
jgi:hypothetical protein